MGLKGFTPHKVGFTDCPDREKERRFMENRKLVDQEMRTMYWSSG